MKKKYISPVVSIVKIDNSIMNVAISDGSADQKGEVYSKKNTISFSDEDDDDVAIGW